MHKEIKTINSSKSKILERGDIYFFYRPRVASDEKNKNITVQKSEDIQRFYFVLHPEKSSAYRLILIGKKKLPLIADKHEKEWALVDLVTSDRQALLDELNEQTYSTRTRGQRVLPAARPAGEGVYCLIAHGKNIYLAYVLELPSKQGEVQKALDIEPQASYVLSVKNPQASGKRSTKEANYPARLQQKFKNLRFIPANPPELLNYEGAELLLIGAQTNIQQELGVEIKQESETINTADIFQELQLWKKDHPITPLFAGHWA
jgi:hypothetical protein